MQGKLIIFEGIDHVGKSTIIQNIFNSMSARGERVQIFQFPGKVDGSLGKFVYDLHHGTYKQIHYPIDPFSLQLLHIAAHIDLLNSKILPALLEGQTILLDRYWWSTIAYGAGDDLNMPELLKAISIEKDLTDKIHDKVIFYINREEREKDFECSKDEKIISAYRNLFENYLGEKYIVENDGKIEEAVNFILETIKL